jgi:predicted GIY-YIG superfamily endonuclease
MAQIVGYTVFIIEGSDSSYYSGFCRDLSKRLKEIEEGKVCYFSQHPEKFPIKVVFREDNIFFKEAFAKAKYLKTMTKRHRNGLIKNNKWPLGGALKEYYKKIKAL